MNRVLIASLAPICFLTGCSDRAPAPAPAFDQIYTTRGVIRALKDPSNPASELSIQHERIPEFVNGAGEVSGMASMTMPFPTLAPGVSLDGIALGDKVRFTFGVTWNQGVSARYPTWTITAIEKLPPETELVFRAPPAPAPDVEPSHEPDSEPTPAAAPNQAP